MEKYLVLFMFTYIAYIFGFSIYNFFIRKKAISNQLVKMSHFRSYTTSGPEHLKIYSNHYSNQFQIPILFLVTCLVILVFKSTSIVTLSLAGLFLASRLVHAYIHLTYNNVIHRALAFASGGFTLLFMWIEILLFIF